VVLFGGAIFAYLLGNFFEGECGDSPLFIAPLRILFFSKRRPEPEGEADPPGSRRHPDRTGTHRISGMGETVFNVIVEGYQYRTFQPCPSGS